MDLNSLSNKYFNNWNSNKIENLKDLFSENCSLRDWTINVSGKDDVLSANKKIFDDVPGIRAEIINLHLSDKSNTAVAEIIVHLSEKEKLKVVDVLTFDQDGLIKSIRAYQG